MNNAISTKLVAVLLFISIPSVIIPSQKKTKVSVDLYVDRLCEGFSTIGDSNIRSENRQRCINFGFQDKKGLGIVEVRAFYDDPRYQNIISQKSSLGQKRDAGYDWVLLVPTDVIEKNNAKIQGKKVNTFGDVFNVTANSVLAALNRYSSTIGVLRYDNLAFYEGIAGFLTYDPHFFKKATDKYAHPRFIPAACVVDKKIGDKFTVQAHGCEIEYTIKSFPGDEKTRIFFKLLSWQKYMYECASNNAGIIKVFAVLLAIKILFLR